LWVCNARQATTAVTMIEVPFRLRECAPHERLSLGQPPCAPRCAGIDRSAKLLGKSTRIGVLQVARIAASHSP
jgi:hypothetical protein